jgi:hypothetical protein
MNKMLNDQESKSLPKTWVDQKANLRKKFTVLRDHDLNYEESEKTEMISKLQAKLGLSDERLLSIMEGR